MQAANPFADLVPGAPPAQAQQPLRPLIPRQPPPRTPEEIEAARLDNIHREQRNAIEAAQMPPPPSPASNLTGEDYLATLPQRDQALIRSLSEGRMEIPGGAALRSPQWARILEQANQYDPTLDIANVRSRINARRNYTSGPESRNVTSLNTALGHLETLARQADNLDNYSLRPANVIRNAIRTQAGSSATTTFEQTRNAVASEMRKVFAGSGGNLQEFQEWQSGFDAASSPEQLHASIQNAVELLNSRLVSVSDSYNRAMGRANGTPEWLAPHAREVLGRYGHGEWGGRTPPSERGVGGVPATDNLPPAPTNFSSEQASRYDAWTREHPHFTADELMAFTERELGGRMTSERADAIVRFRDQGGGVAPGSSGRVDPNLEGSRGDGAEVGLGLRSAINSAMPFFGPAVRGVGQTYGPETGDAFTRGIYDVPTFGLSDEATAGGETLLGQGPYGLNLAREQAIGHYDERNHPLARFTGQLLGGSALPISRAAGIGRMMLEGTGYGMAYGLGSGEGVQGRLTNAGLGAAVGAGIPPILRVAQGAGSLAYGLGRRLVGGNPAPFARRVIADAIQADANTPASVAGQMAEANRNDVPYMIADSGDNVRGLLAASSRAPGPARTVARDALRERQGGLADRVAAAVERDLGPAANPHEVRERLIQEATAAAGPLYDAAYARPGADTFGRRVQGLFNRPSMRNAMAGAARIAAEEGRDPTTLGFEINAAGETTLTHVPSWQTLDYVKRGLDDIVESYRDPTTGRLNLDTYGRAANSTLRGFVRMFRAANPDYAQALNAYAGPVRARSAMDVGLNALNMSADDLSARTARMTPGEMDFVRLGVRRAMVERVTSRGDTADVTHALIGTGRKRAMLARLFGGQQEFDRFTRTLQAEQEGFQTYRTAMQGSPTAPNFQDDQALEQSLNAAGALVSGHGLGTALREGIKFGIGRSGDQVREQLATLLSETDPTTLLELGRDLVREAARRRRGVGNRNYAIGQLGRATTGQVVLPGVGAGNQGPQSP